jgi:hypothetical protein
MPGYPYVLIATDILKEGEDLHSYCKNIYHYGIAWNPSDMEQRTGRVDRIDSMAYRSIKEISDTDISEIPFARKLQVFYPYLADTLEVNQMSNLFIGMNKFIEIFYHDLSAKIEKCPKAKIDILVDNILPQKSGLLESKYDIDNFVDAGEIGDPLILRKIEGFKLEELAEKLKELYYLLENEEHYQLPYLDISTLSIYGKLKIRTNRQGPYIISIDQKEELGHFCFRIESCLGRVQVFGSKSSKQKINNSVIEESKLSGLNFKAIERNSAIWIQVFADLNDEIIINCDKLKRLVEFTDILEERISKKDESLDDYN